MKTAAEVTAHLRTLGDPATAQSLQGFFQTGPGGYGAGDRFLGIRVPALRALTRDAAALLPAELRRLLRSPWHEARLLALFGMVHSYQRGTLTARDRLHRLYLAELRHINNWDLVDSSAEYLVGAHLRDGRAKPALLDQFTVSPSVWPRRIAVLAMFHFIKQGDFELPLRQLVRTLRDPHPLIHKAAGWMLRELGKRAPTPAARFLDQHAAAMPRTMLRYALERLPKPTHKRYLTAR